ncbi:MAG TPA: hypothetical protein VH643_20820 [Gemmataceae bacterium]|jgi:hypothetical protein
MATDLGRAKSTSSKYDAFIALQLARAESRVRFLDLTAALLGFAALTLAYVVAMVVFDSQLELSQHARKLSLYAFFLGAAAYLFFAVVRPLRLRVNPYYAARQVEQQLPGAKNSIVNWVDLHEQALPPAIRGALGQRAAKDLSRVDLDRAISGRRAAWTGGVAGLLALAFIAAFFLLGPSPFVSLLQRAFNPFGQVGVSTRTQLALIKPEGGNTTVTVGRGVGFVVEVSGKVPDPKAADAVKLLYRYEEGDPWLERGLVPESGREWTTSLSAIEIKNGLWYRITGGDATTEEYRISVRAAPAITDFLATYHFRPYVARADEVRRERDLKALRGTEVLLRVRTNRTVREGRLEFEGVSGPKNILSQPSADDPRTLLFRLVLEESGKYRLHFYSTDNEGYSDANASPVIVLPDEKPSVELTKPGQDIRLPVNGLLQLEGKASDDIGVKSVALRMRMVGGDKLQGRPYRSDEKLRLADGGYPRELEYKDFVELSGVKGEDGLPFPLRAGMELEYWLEARDACDYPRPNPPGESKHFRVTLTEPEKNEQKEQQEKKQAEKDKKQHEDKQDQKLRKEEQQRQEERKEQEAQNKEQQDKSKQADKGAGENNAGQQEGDKAEGKDGNGQGESKNDLSKEQQDTENKIKDALEKKEQGENDPGEAKPDKGDQGEGKGAQKNEPGGNQAGEKSEGEGKDKGGQGAEKAGEGKDKGEPQSGGDPSQGDGKGEKQPNPMAGDKSEPKGGDPMNQSGAGEAAEGKGKPDQKPQPGEGKPGGDAQESKAAGQGKPQPMGQDKDSGNGDGKPSDPKGQQADREATAEAKHKSGGNTRSEPKGEGDNKDGGKAEVKQGGSAPMGDKSAQGEAKPSGNGEGDKFARGEGKGDAREQARKATQKDIEDLVKDLESKDAQRREEAKRQLERIAEQARDSQAREKAEEALDKAGQPDGTADAKPPQPGNGSSDKPNGDSKDGKNNESKTPGDSGSGDGDKKPGDGDAKGKKGERGSSSDGKGEGTRASEGGNNPGGGTQRRDGDGNRGGGGDAGAGPHKPSKPRGHRATQMQLDDFAKKVNKDILKDAGVSEEEWKKYLEARRKQIASEKPRSETPADPQQAVKLPSMGGRTIGSTSDQPGDIHGADRGQPPPGYRDSFREFTRKMSKKN